MIADIGWYKETLTSHHRYLAQTLTRLYANDDHTVICERVDRQLTTATSVALYTESWATPEAQAKQRRIRLQVWAIDSLLWAIEEYQLGHYTHAFRGYVQAVGYTSELGNTTYTSDGLTHLRNAIEAVTERVVAEETYCRCGVTRAVCNASTHSTHELRMRDVSNQEGA